MKSVKLCFVIGLIILTALMIDAESVNIAGTLADGGKNVFLLSAGRILAIKTITTTVQHPAESFEASYYVEGDVTLSDSGSGYEDSHCYFSGQSMYILFDNIAQYPVTGGLADGVYTITRTIKGYTVFMIHITIQHKTWPSQFTVGSLNNCTKHPDFFTNRIIKPLSGFSASFTDTNTMYTKRKYNWKLDSNPSDIRTITADSGQSQFTIDLSNITFTTGTYNLYIQAVYDDIFTGIWGGYTFKVDVDAPAAVAGTKIKVNDINISASNTGTQYFSPNNVIFAFTYDPVTDTGGAGIKGYELQVCNASVTPDTANGSVILVSGNQTAVKLLNADLAYKLWIRAADYVGNASAWSASGLFAIDEDAPQFPVTENLSAQLQALKPAPGNLAQIDNVRLTWPAALDAESGLAGYAVYQNGALITPAITSTPAGCYCDIALNSNQRGGSLTFKVRAADKVGNTADTRELTVNLPRLINARSITSGLTDMNAYDADIAVNVMLDVTEEYLKSNYAAIQFVRVGSRLPESLTKDSAEFAIYGIDFTSSTQWVVDESGFVIYKDILPPGAGHRNIQYRILQIPLESTGVQAVKEEAALSPNHALVNNPGQIRELRLMDAKGNIFDPAIPGPQPAFTMNASWEAFVAFRASDANNELWRYSVNKTQMIHAEPQIMSCLAMSAEHEHFITQAQDEWVEVPVTLFYGQNDIVVVWEEVSPDAGVSAVDGNPLSAILRIIIERTDSGFTIRVTDSWAQDGSDGITVRPGEPLSISVSPDADSRDNWVYAWDFGDNITATGADIEHRYDQRLNQATNSTDYLLGIAIERINSMPGEIINIGIPIHVKDTQVGQLFESEVWRGEHTVTGQVIVPAGLTLSMAPEADTAMDVIFEGGIAAGYDQGILVKQGASLRTGGGAVNFYRTTTQTQAWDTLRIEGNAVLANADITQAARAITIAPTGVLTLTNANLHGNGIGIHVVASTAVMLRDCRITANTEFGIKEDAGGGVTLTNVRFSGNRKDYYDWYDGILTPEELYIQFGIIPGQGE